MHAFAPLYFATVEPGSAVFSWPWAIFGAGMALLFALVALGYRAGWFLPKYRLREADPLQDALLRNIFGPPAQAARSRRQAQVVPRYQLSGYRSDGFKVVRIAFGRESLIGSQCIYAAPRDDGTTEEQVLVARGQSTAQPLSLLELLNELGRTLTGLERAFQVHVREVQAARGFYRERLHGLKRRHEAHYLEYRQGQAAREGAHTLSTQLTGCEARIKDLDKRLDEMK